MIMRLILIGTYCIMLTFCSTNKKLSDTRPLLLEIKDKTLIPEGIAVHPSTGKIYVSSLHQNKIVAVDNNGAVTDVIASGQNGFTWGLGMKFSNDGTILWACSADGKGGTALFAVDHRQEKILKSFTHDSARFLNDLVIINDGRIFITDTESGALFLLQNDSLQLFLRTEELKWANGIAATPDGKTLFAASGRYGVKKIDVASRAVTSATNNKRTDYAIDGLVLHKHTLYAAIGWPQDSLHQHRVVRYYLDEKFIYRSADTLAVNQPWLQCPTTLAVHNNQLFVLSTMSLGLYNRHNQQTGKIMDSLQHPRLVVFKL